MYYSLQGLIFVVDSNDKERAAEAHDELSKMVLDNCLLDDDENGKEVKLFLKVLPFSLKGT